MWIRVRPTNDDDEVHSENTYKGARCVNEAVEQLCYLRIFLFNDATS